MQQQSWPLPLALCLVGALSLMGAGLALGTGRDRNRTTGDSATDTASPADPGSLVLQRWLAGP